MTFVSNGVLSELHNVILQKLVVRHWHAVPKSVSSRSTSRIINNFSVIL